MLKQDRNAIWGLLIIVVGLILLMDSLGFIDFNLWHLLGKLWPLVLILIGLMVIFGRGKHVNDVTNDTTAGDSSGEQKISCESTAFGMFGDIRIAGLTQSVGDIEKSLLLGDIVVDLTGAKLAVGENKVDISVLLSDIDIIVPASFPISVDLSCLLGSITCDLQKSDGFAPKINFSDDNFAGAGSKLIISAKALIGDIKIMRQSG